MCAAGRVSPQSGNTPSLWSSAVDDSVTQQMITFIVNAFVICRQWVAEYCGCYTTDYVETTVKDLTSYCLLLSVDLKLSQWLVAFLFNYCMMVIGNDTPQCRAFSKDPKLMGSQLSLPRGWCSWIPPCSGSLSSVLCIQMCSVHTDSDVFIHRSSRLHVLLRTCPVAGRQTHSSHAELSAVRYWNRTTEISFGPLTT